MTRFSLQPSFAFPARAPRAAGNPRSRRTPLGFPATRPLWSGVTRPFTVLHLFRWMLGLGCPRNRQFTLATNVLFCTRDHAKTANYSDTNCCTATACDNTVTGLVTPDH